MAVRIRLARGGRKKKPLYRIIAADSESPRDGKFLENLGTYNPNTEPAAIVLDKEKVLKWLRTGAKPTDTVRALLKKDGVLDAFAKEAKA